MDIAQQKELFARATGANRKAAPAAPTIPAQPKTRAIPANPALQGSLIAAGLPLPPTAIPVQDNQNPADISAQEIVNRLTEVPSFDMPQFADAMNNEAYERKKQEVLSKVTTQKPQSVDINKLSADKQAEVLQLLRDSQILDLEDNMVEMDEVTITDQSATPKVAPKVVVPEPAPAPTPPPAPKVEEPQFKDVGPKFCVHCGYDQSLPVSIEPTEFDKEAFIAATIAQKSFTKEFSLLGGELLVCFRSLTPREIDSASDQALRDYEKQRIRYQGDVAESVNRYNMYLQLAYIRSRRAGGIDATFPKGFTPETNPDAGSYWPLQADTDFVDGDNGLQAVAKFITTTIVKSENLMRMLFIAHGQFLRLCAMLEARLDDSPFWKKADSSTS